MNLRELSNAVLSEPKWQAIWYIVNSIACAITCFLLSRFGFLPWDDLTAVLLGFFVPLGVYGFKAANGWYRYKQHYGLYAWLEKNLELAIDKYQHEDYEQALDILKQILYNQPGHIRALYYSALCKEQIGDAKGALNDIDEYLQAKPDDIQALQIRQRIV
jgi:tetratricopeptide (TPR) repeat protein